MISVLPQLRTATYTEVEEFLRSLSGTEPEDRSLDLKRQLPQPNKDNKKFCDRVAAFANTGGGLILYGAGEDKDAQTVAITPIDRADYAKFSERANQIVGTLIDPPCEIDVVLVEEHDSNNCFILVFVEDGRLRPYQSDKRFPLRAGTITAYATRTQVIDMIYATRAREERLAAKLAARKIVDVEADDFCLNNNALRLPQKEVDEKFAQDESIKAWLASSPTACFAATPLEEISMRRLKPTDAEVFRRLAAEAASWEVMPNPRFTTSNNVRKTASGLTFHSVEYDNRSILELHNDGHAEVVSRDCWYVGPQHQGTPITAVFLSGIVGYATTFLYSHMTFLQHQADYSGEVLLTIALRGLGNCCLLGLKKRSSRHLRSPPMPFADNSVLFTYVADLDLFEGEPASTALISRIAEDIAAVFGLDSPEQWYDSFPQDLCTHQGHHGMPFAP